MLCINLSAGFCFGAAASVICSLCGSDAPQKIEMFIVLFLSFNALAKRGICGQCTGC